MPEPSAHSPRRRRSTPDPQRRPWGFDTVAVHGAFEPDLNAGSVIPPVYQTSTYHYPAAYSEASEHGQVHLYTRIDNPNLTQAGEVVRALEGAGAGRVYASGMAAITTPILGLLRSGDEIVAVEDLYGNTLSFLRDDVGRYGITVRWVPCDRSEDVGAYVSPRTKLLLVESPTNPTLRVHDLDRWVAAARSVGAPLLVDNTFASPVNQSPIARGADLVMHSGTKYLAGHSDLIAGALVGRKDLIESLDVFSHTLGATLDTMAAFLLVRGIKTLPLRVRRQNESARAIAEELRRHPKIEAVHTPGSTSPEQEAICARQMRGRTGMISPVVKGGLEAARRVMAHFEIIHPASSLGGVESLASLPVETSHRQLSPAERARRGIADGLVRVSLGVEDPADLLADFRQALDHA